MKIHPIHAADFYKTGHRVQYPKGTNVVYSNFTPRSDHLAKRGEMYDGKIVTFGLQYFIKSFLLQTFAEQFFNKPKEEVIARYKRRLDNSLGKDAVDVDHIEALHDLGYLPIEIKALPEGSLVPIKCPVLTIHNTLPEFFWLTNYLESVMSCMLWQPTTSATIARQYRLLLDKYAEETGADKGFVDFQAHDFSFRGMPGIEAAAMSGAGHLLFFKGTDTIPAIDLLEDYYGADSDKELIGCSVPATEHSVMSMGSQDDELGTFRRLITETYPKGIVSIVSDTWDLWKVLDEYAPALKAEIEAREGKIVFRPDSGNPADIICGKPVPPRGEVATVQEIQGCLKLLWKHFGGTVNDKGFKVLNPKIGLIYGDSITLGRASDILARMKDMGFCSSNIVFGVGSFTYQHNTRDTYGFAMKATYGEINGVAQMICKNPVTDSGVKKSLKGIISIAKVNGNYLPVDELTDINTPSEMKTVFLNGKLIQEATLQEIRDVANGNKD
jgi:nicotinamide phosphoribosyltransferase